MLEYSNLKNITVEIDKNFLSIRVQANDFDIFKTLLSSLNTIISPDTPISLKQICNYHPSSSQQMISKIISKEIDIENCLNETKHLISIIRR